MADQNLNINLNEFGRPDPERQSFPETGGTESSRGPIPDTPNAHAPQPEPPETPPPPESPESVTGQILQLAVTPIMETLLGRNPITGAARTAMNFAVENEDTILGLLGMGTGSASAAATGEAAAAATGAGSGAAGAGAGAAGGMSGIAAAAGPVGIALAGLVVVTGAVVSAFLYAKDQFLDAAREVSMFTGQTAAAQAQSEVQDLFNKINRANQLQDEFSEMIRLQTDIDKAWSEMNSDLMEVFSPVVSEGMEQLKALVETARDAVEFAKPLLKIETGMFATLLEATTITGVIKKIRNLIEDWIGEQEEEIPDQFKLIEKLLNENLQRVRAGQLPKNGGLGG